MAEAFTVSGSVDPTTLYTKQQCIGRRIGPSHFWGQANDVQVVAVLARSTKGAYCMQLHGADVALTEHRIDRKNGQLVAIKIIDVENAEDEVDDIISEIAILSGMNSQYVTKYYGSYLHGTELWIVMEFCSGGSCADLMRPGAIDESEIAVILKELLMGLCYLHEDNKLHRDIKGEHSC